MLDCLRTKFCKTSSYYKKMLLSTGEQKLHVAPLKGDPGKWTYMNGKGGDLIPYTKTARPHSGQLTERAK